MRRLTTACAVALLLAGSLGGFAREARAGSEANAWITIATARPGVGCAVAVNAEVRSDGNPVSGITVSIAFFNGSNEVLATDAATTDADGIAALAFDTSGASAGDDGWLDISIGDTYAGGTAIDPTGGGGCDGDAKELTASVGVTIPSGDSGGGDDGGGWFPTHYQDHSLSCEYASLQIATSALGNEVSEETFLGIVPGADDPHYGFRGDIDGAWGSTDDYGVYAEPLADALAQVGFSGNVWYDPDAGALQAQLDAGNPTLVWIATRGDGGFYDEDADGNSFKLVPYEHVVVAFSYDDSGVYVSDPGNGSIEHFSWDWFLGAWSALNGMALSVSPA